jgi:predicted RNA-binding Zn-ribbon protein involved in translation (DUF1610 family)
MAYKYKPAAFVFFDKQILIECPFCGWTLIRTDYQRIQRLVHYVGQPRGKICPNCGGVAVLKLNDQAREMILSKLSSERSSE